MSLYAPILLLPCSRKLPLPPPSSPRSLPRLGGIQRRLKIAKATASEPSRRSGNFQPTIWEDNYIQTLSVRFTEGECFIRRDKLKEDMRHLIGKEKGLVEPLELVDNLRQLGLSYHFEMEIKDALKSINSMESINNELKNNLHGNALLFRLLREYGLHAPQSSMDLVNNFKCEKAKYNVNLEHDVKGMLSLYEASYLAVDGEDALDEAGEYAAKFLDNAKRSSVNPQLIEQIDHALELPLHWRTPRLHTRWFIDVSKTHNCMDPMLLELAKLDFNIVQSTYKNELKEMSRWWRNLGIVCDKLDFARDRLVEHYLWAMGFCFEPKYWIFRKGITKINCFITTVDDIYDVYGTLDELELFTEMVNKWEFDALQLLPDYMKTCLTLLFDTVNEIANIASTMQGIHVLPYLKRSIYATLT